MVKRWVFKWGELQAGSTQSSTLMASSEFFAHSAYLGREAEFFPAGEQPLKGKAFARLHKERVCLSLGAGFQALPKNLARQGTLGTRS